MAGTSDSNPWATMIEIKNLAHALTETERATLAAHLLDSLSPVLYDEDEGIAEPVRCDAELAANPSLGLSLDQSADQASPKRCGSFFIRRSIAHRILNLTRQNEH